MNAWIEIDLGALAHNTATLRETMGDAVDVIAVVKANAYGAGAARFAFELQRLGVPRFAVVWTSEAVALREAGITKPIIVLGHSFPADAPIAVANGVTLTCHSLELGEALSRAATALERTALVHIKVDTGLHRFGVTLDEAVTLGGQLHQLPNLLVEGLTTHMANADEPDDSFADTQDALFAKAAARLPWIPYRHTANSATALRREGLRYQGIRSGLALHGVVPPNSPNPGLRPVLALRARLARVAEVEAGEGVSYGLTWRAERPSRVGLVPVGYADGWRRALGNMGSVLFNSVRCPMVGRVCMDQFLIDVTDQPAAVEGSVVTLLGADGAAGITADEVAAESGTISWDVLASLQARLPRLYVRDGLVEAITA
ncbi:MAG: alanine racemase [Anaerolineaceae bacterium]